MKFGINDLVRQDLRQGTFMFTSKDIKHSLHLLENCVVNPLSRAARFEEALIDIRKDWLMSPHHLEQIKGCREFYKAISTELGDMKTQQMKASAIRRTGIVDDIMRIRDSSSASRQRMYGWELTLFHSIHASLRALEVAFPDWK